MKFPMSIIAIYMWYKMSAATFRFSAYETLNKILRKPTIPFLICRVKFLAEHFLGIFYFEYILNYAFCIDKMFEFYVYIQLHVQTAIKGNSH